MRKQTNTLSPSPNGFQSPKFSDSDFREVRGLGLGLGRPKISDIFNNVLTNLSFMDFLFYIPFFCTAATAVTEILNVCL
jgi:hypothetical protein